MKKFLFCSLIFSVPLFAKFDPYVFHFEGRFQELYRAGRYHLIEKIIEPDDVILEAGGFDGMDTIALSAMVPEGKVLTFEPNPPRYQEMVTKTKHLSNVSAYPFALGEENGSATFYVCYGAQYDPVYEGASSLLPPAASMEINYQGPRIKVPCKRLDDWCKENNQSKIDFMWLDLEGYELQVLKNGSEILSTVKAIYIETNFYQFRKGMTQYKELKKFLGKEGFKLLSYGYYKGFQGNAIFVRKGLFDETVEKIIAKS